MMSRVSGSRTAITCMVIRLGSSGTTEINNQQLAIRTAKAEPTLLPRNASFRFGYLLIANC
jgi:hypothetical protein